MIRLAAAAPVSVDTIDATDAADGRFVEVRLGGAVYSALAAARWGHRGAIVGPVGEDAEALVRARLAEAGVDASGLVVGPWPTRRVSIREPAEVLTQSTQVDVAGDPATYDPEALRARLRGADVVLGYGHALALARAALMAAAPAALTAVDLQDLEDLDAVGALAAASAWTLVSWPSVRSLTGARTVAEAYDALRGLGARGVVLKLGPGGSVVWSDAGSRRDVPAWLGPFRQTVGAGDVFNAVFLIEVRSGVAPDLAAATASRAAGVHASESGEPTAAVEPAYAAAPQRRGRGGDARLPPVPTRAAVERAAARCVPVHSTPDARAGFSIHVLAPGRTAAERHYADRLTRAVAGHGFAWSATVVGSDPWTDPLDDASGGACEHAAESRPDAELRNAPDADLVLVVLDGGEPRLLALAADLAAADTPFIGFESDPRRPGAASLPAGGDVLVARDERQLLAGLYAWAGGGRDAATALANAFQDSTRAPRTREAWR
jgi:sugar/nucleoside kinase (ribokinase family)